MDEALCFGWIDSVAKPIDEEHVQAIFYEKKAPAQFQKPPLVVKKQLQVVWLQP